MPQHVEFKGNIFLRVKLGLRIVGTYISSTSIMKNSELIDDQILSFSNGLIKSYSEEEFSIEDGVSRVLLDVVVKKGEVQEKLKGNNLIKVSVGLKSEKERIRKILAREKIEQNEKIEAQKREDRVNRSITKSSVSNFNDFKRLVQKIIIDPILKGDVFTIKKKEFDVYEIKNIETYTALASNSDQVEALESVGFDALTASNLVRDNELTFITELVKGFNPKHKVGGLGLNVYVRDLGTRQLLDDPLVISNPLKRKEKTLSSFTGKYLVKMVYNASLSENYFNSARDFFSATAITYEKGVLSKEMERDKYKYAVFLSKISHARKRQLLTYAFLFDKEKFSFIQEKTLSDLRKNSLSIEYIAYDVEGFPLFKVSSASCRTETKALMCSKKSDSITLNENKLGLDLLRFGFDFESSFPFKIAYLNDAVDFETYFVLTKEEMLLFDSMEVKLKVNYE